MESLGEGEAFRSILGVTEQKSTEREAPLLKRVTGSVPIIIAYEAGPYQRDPLMVKKKKDVSSAFFISPHPNISGKYLRRFQ